MEKLEAAIEAILFSAGDSVETDAFARQPLVVISGPPQMGRIVRFTPGTEGSIPALS